MWVMANSGVQIVENALMQQSKDPEPAPTARILPAVLWFAFGAGATALAAALMAGI